MTRKSLTPCTSASSPHLIGRPTKAKIADSKAAWEFTGEMTNPPDGDNDMAIVFLEGSAEIECGGQSYSVTAGDLIVFEGPVAAKNYRSDGFRAVYLRRFHGVPPTDEERARARAGGPKPEGGG